jgi:RNA polymerase sigma-32 factor
MTTSGGQIDADRSRRCCNTGRVSRIPFERGGHGKHTLETNATLITARCRPLSDKTNYEGHMHNTYSQPLPSIATGLTHYLAQIKKFPILTQEEEIQFARRWRQLGDRDAAYRLVTSHLRLVAKIAMRYRGYGLPIADIVSEGNIGLMQAVRRFDPERGVRLSTYALWWIKATIQEYVLRSWSMVKVSANNAQKKLFFKLRQAKRAISAVEDGDLRPEQVQAIAARLEVPEREVVDMDRRLRGDVSLNSRTYDDPDADEAIERLVDPSPAQDDKLADEHELAQRRQALRAAIQTLGPRERHIFTARRLTDTPPTLEELAAEYGVSRERVRQIEQRAFEKIRLAMQPAGNSLKPRQLVATNAMSIQSTQENRERPLSASY